jgi:hypothetical protein
MLGKRLSNKELTDFLATAKPYTFIHDPNDNNIVYTMEDFHTNAGYDDKNSPSLHWQELMRVQKLYKEPTQIRMLIKRIFEDLTVRGFMHKNRYQEGDFYFITGHCGTGGIDIEIPKGEDPYGNQMYSRTTYYPTKKADAVEYARTIDDYAKVYVAQIVTEVKIREERRY